MNPQRPESEWWAVVVSWHGDEPQVFGPFRHYRTADAERERIGYLPNAAVSVLRMARGDRTEAQ